MISEDALAVAARVGIVAAALFVAVPGAIWWLIKYFEFIAWVVG